MTGAPPAPTQPQPAPSIPWALAAVASIPALLGIWLGYGTDIDIANVLRAGESAIEGDYLYSRTPGSYVHEAATWVLDLAGGSVLVALASVVLGAVALGGIGWLVRSEGQPAAPTVVLVAASPWWWVASTSLGDFVWAAAAVVMGAMAARRDARVLAGLLFGLAVGLRASSGLLVAAWLAAELLGGEGRPSRRAVLTTALVAGVAGALCFLPSWLAADRTLDFLENTYEVTSFRTLVGRWLVKNLAFWGPVAVVALVAGTGVLRDCLRRWHESVLVRFGVLGFVATELLYLRFPWKPLHLLPALVCLALVLSASSNRWLRVALVVGGLLHAVATITVASPDVPHHATTGRFSLAVTDGVIVNDVRCRLDDRDAGPWPDPATPEAADRAFALFECQADLWRS